MTPKTIEAELTEQLSRLARSVAKACAHDSGGCTIHEDAHHAVRLADAACGVMNVTVRLARARAPKPKTTTHTSFSEF